MSERGRPLSNTLFSSLGLYSEYLFGLTASILIARALGPAELGVYSLAVWIVGTAVVVANAGITTGAIKFIAELRGAGEHALVRPLVDRLRRLQRWMLLIVATAVGVGFAWVGERVMPGVDVALFSLLVVSLGLRAPYMFNIALAKGNQDFRATAAIALAGAACNLLMVAVAFMLDAPLATYLAIYAISSGVFFAVSDRAAQRILAAVAPTGGDARLPPALRDRLRHHLRVVAFTIILTSVGGSEFELLFLNLLTEPADAGVFKVAIALAMGAALLVPGVLGAQLLPMMANAYGHGPQAAAQRIGSTTAWLFLLGAPLVGFVAVFSEHLIHLLYGTQYTSAGAILIWLLLGRVAATLGQGASAYLVSADRQTALMYLGIGLSALRLGAAWTSIAWFGLAGAVAATLVLSVLGTASTVWLALHETRSRLPWARMLRMGVAAALGAMCVLPLATRLPELPGLLAGSIAYALLYPLALWLLRCLTEEDADYVRAVGLRISAGARRLCAARRA